MMTVRKIWFNKEFLSVTGRGTNPKGQFLRGKEYVHTGFLKPLLEIGFNCNDAKKGKKGNKIQYLGNPTEIALIISAEKGNVEKAYTRISEIPFSSKSKIMFTAHEINGNKKAFLKGAPEELIKRCSRFFYNGKITVLDDKTRKGILNANTLMAKQALRVLGFAYKEITKDLEEEKESNFVFVGLQGMIDPPRKGVKEAIQACLDAGITVKMITGDNLITAKAIGKEVGIQGLAIEGSELDNLTPEELRKIVEKIGIFARVAPKHKVMILQALKKNGLLLRVPSHDEITEFADLVGTVRTNRILDFRLRNIEILETTINYLIEEKLIDQLSTLAILIIGDTYQYDQIISRNAGSRLEFTLAPSAHFSKNNTVPVQSLSPNETLTLQTTGRVDHVSYNNIDIKWMKTRSYGARIEFSNKYEYYADILLENRTTKTGVAGITYNYGYRYLPNLRNNFNLNLETGILMAATFKENQSTTYSNARLLIRLHTGFNHYFSPSTQFNVTGGLVYYDSQFQGGDFQPEINGYLNFAINHAIF
jgi:hypothetical protein